MTSKNNSNFKTVRREYGKLALDEAEMKTYPIEQARVWLKQAVESETQDPTAMVLSTVDVQSRPDARVLLLKEIQDTGFVFYTHYGSLKGEQLEANPQVALTFYWPVLVRQLRVRGVASFLSKTASDEYFASRPYLSQISACASHQSHEIPDRASLLATVNQLKAKYPEGTVPRPAEWGGYIVTPQEVEFWQGRDDRLHDRILYRLKEKQWKKLRLAP